MQRKILYSGWGDAASELCRVMSEWQRETRAMFESSLAQYNNGTRYNAQLYNSFLLSTNNAYVLLFAQPNANYCE